MRSSDARAFRVGRFPAAIRLVALLTLATAGLAASLPAVAAPSTSSAPWCRADGVLRAADLPAQALPGSCALDGRVIEDNGAMAEVPAPGEKIAAETMHADGGTQVLELTRHSDGTLILAQVGDEAHAEHGVEGASAGGTTMNTMGASDCHDNAFQLSDYRDTNTRTWYYKSSTTPPGLSIGAVAQDLVDAFNTITSSINECGLPDEVEAGQRYGGNTTVPSGIDHTGACPAKGDGHYVVDFGNLPENTLARTCWRGVRTAQGWYEITEADVKIRKAAALFTGAVPAGCSGPRYSIRAIVTHEAGHSFGLRHVAEANHPELTMSERTPACSLAPASLGLGDVEALRAAY